MLNSIKTDEGKILLDKIQKVFFVPEIKSKLIIDSLLRYQKIISEKEVDNFLSLTLINKILMMLNQNETYFNQYFLFSVLDMPQSKLIDINQFLIGINKINCKKEV